MQSSIMSSLRAEAIDAPASQIIEIIKYADGKDDITPLWAGQGVLPTPDFICDAATRSLAAGETFYTYQRGISELREAIARYHERLYGRPFDPERFFVVGSGMQAIQMAVRMVAGPGDEIVLPTPAWPNLSAAVGIASAKAVEVPMQFRPEGWHLDLDALFGACTERTKAIFINSPSNPTGWVADEAELRAILAFAREKGIWIIADEIYTRFYYGEGRDTAPSFYEIMDEDDRILFVNSFSKNWAMTGWRVGWISAPPAMGDIIENLIQYSTSGVAVFMQRAAIAALEDGEAFVAKQIEQARVGRSKLLEAFEGNNQLRFAAPKGSFYFFFGLADEPDAWPLTKQLVDEAKVGLAPGFAFGQSGCAFMRLCFATTSEQMDRAVMRLNRWLSARDAMPERVLDLEQA
ncbi:pyridoxal phosphate-dependent aminotransferase [Cohaesibacter intestini]|uniref:pyridoxal phosphate-dependent aminotransferase n=1 Tax=Cohaesibacter intestini TaxID=2211145 RepID=UPI000DEA98C5|nr:pyridoxal phosphate-dependent aminotransferase [Cohaesibacter intestini]